jgi:hypothetical protein
LATPALRPSLQENTYNKFSIFLNFRDPKKTPVKRIMQIAQIEQKENWTKNRPFI